MKKEKRYGRTGAAGGMDSSVGGYGIRLLSVLVFFILAILPACRSHKKMATETLVETHKEMATETLVETHESGRERTDSNSQQMSAASEENTSDTTRILSHTVTSVVVTRDSAGRILGIRAERKEDQSGYRGTRRTQTADLESTQHSKSSEVADSTYRKSEKKEKKEKNEKNEKKEKKETSSGSGRAIEFLIGMSLVGFVIGCYIGDYIFKLWKRKRAQ